MYVREYQVKLEYRLPSEYPVSSLSGTKKNRQKPERDDHGPPVVPEGLGSRNLRTRAEARPTGRAVFKVRLGDWDGHIYV